MHADHQSTALAYINRSNRPVVKRRVKTGSGTGRSGSIIFCFIKGPSNAIRNKGTVMRFSEQNLIGDGNPNVQIVEPKPW